MICAASYSGPNAPFLARQLAEDVRTKHKVPAYIFNHANEERRKQAEDYERARQTALAQGSPVAPRRRIFRIEEQCAVLIGGPGAGWADIDPATSYLKKVRQWPLPDLKLDNGLPAFDQTLDVTPDNTGRPQIKRVNVNPFLTSFVIRNPAVPQASQEKPRFDPFWKKLNANEDFSLLECPQPWTLAVKVYSSPGVVQPSGSGGFLDKIGLGGLRPGEGISAAGLQAHHLADFLRRLGFKAYVLHTRTNSVVTVGEFSGPKDPEMERMQDRLSRLSFKPDPRSPNASRFAAANLELFPRAMPMEVPRP
jgi:hypothetical protein